MVNFNSIKQHFVNMDYGFDNPSSLIVLVPGLAIIVRRIQIVSICRNLDNQLRQNPQFDWHASPENAKIDRIYKWHILGGALQMAASFVLLQKYNLTTLFIVTCIFAWHQILHSAVRCLSYDSVTHIDARTGAVTIQITR